MESGEARWQQGGAPSIGEEAEVADADEALGEQMKEEATEKLIARDGHHFLSIVVGGVTPAKGNLAVRQCDQAMVGDGDAMSIAAQILQHVLGSAEGWFGVDDPIFAEERTQPGSEELGMGERCEFSGQVQLTAFEGRLQSSHELAAKRAPQHSNGKEEAWVGSNPAGVIAGESAGGNDTVDMGMKLEFLVPGMEHAEEADLGSEMGGIARHLQQGFGAGPKQQTVDEFSVLESQRSQLRRQGEDDVDIGRGQQFTTTRRDPAFTRSSLTLRAVPVAARVVGDGGTMSAAGALIDMTAESGGATARDGQQDLEVGPAGAHFRHCYPTSCSTNSTES